MLTLYRCPTCGRFIRYGVGIRPEELDTDERRLLHQTIRDGECVIEQCACPLHKEVKNEDK